MLAGTLALSGYNLADTYFIGQLPGSTALAAMGYTLPVIMLTGCMFRGLGVGMMTPMAHALGAGRQAKARRLVTHGFLLISAFSALTAVSGLLLASRALAFFGAGGAAQNLAGAYLDIWFFGCITAALSMAGNDILIAVGDNKVASGMMILGMLANVLLDPLFIFGYGGFPAMGIRGAALATILAQGLSGVVVWMVIRRRHRLLDFGCYAPRRLQTYSRVIIRFAIPVAIGMLLMPAGSAIMTRIVSGFGDVAVAAVAAAGRLELVAFVVPMSLGISLMPMIAQNFGARQYGRIGECHRFAMQFALFFLLLMAVIFFFAADTLARLFSHDPEVQHWMALSLKIIPWGLAGVEVHRFAGFFYTGTGRPRQAAWLNAMRILLFMIPFSLVALWFGDMRGLFFARLAADILAGGIGYLLSRRVIARLGESSPRIAIPAR